jgi:hypothetical protein
MKKEEYFLFCPVLLKFLIVGVHALENKSVDNILLFPFNLFSDLIVIKDSRSSFGSE